MQRVAKEAGAGSAQKEQAAAAQAGSSRLPQDGDKGRG